MKVLTRLPDMTDPSRSHPDLGMTASQRTDPTIDYSSPKSNWGVARNEPPLCFMALWGAKSHPIFLPKVAA